MSDRRPQPLTVFRLVGASLLVAVVGGLLGAILFAMIVNIDVAVRNGTSLNVSDSLPFAYGFAIVAVPIAWAALLLIGIPAVLWARKFLQSSTALAYLTGLLAGVVCGGVAVDFLFISTAVPIGMLSGGVVGLLWVAAVRRTIATAEFESA